MNLIENLDKRCGTYEITPETAQQLLEHEGAKNRPASAHKVRLYAVQIKRDQWKVNGEPILLSKTGALLDGQHRCLACIQAEKPFRSVILYGDFPFKTLGVGKPRSGADVLGIAGVPNVVAMAAIARACIIHGRAMHREGNPVTSGGFQAMNDTWKLVTNEEIDKWVYKNPESVDLYQKAKATAGKFSLIPLSPLVAAWHLSTKTTSHEIADPWYEGLITGSGIMKGDVRLVLRRTYEGYRTMSKRVAISGMQSLADICKAWAIRDRRDVKLFRRLASEKFEFIR